MRRLALAYVVLMTALLFPLPAFAAPTYSVEQRSTTLTVETDASVHVVDYDKYAFTGPNEGIVFYFYQPEKHESVKVLDVRVAPVDENGDLASDWTKLVMVDSDPESQGAAPGSTASPSERGDGVRPWYSYNLSDGMMRLYFPASAGETYLVEADYVVTNRARVFRDVGELYWRYAHSSSPVDRSDVSLQVVLPLPADAVVEPGENVVAWGHGPEEGTFRIGDDGTVSYLVDCVPAGHYAECHVLFPVSWLSNVTGDSPQYRTEARKGAAFEDEDGWLDANARASIWDNRVRVLFGAIIVACVLLALVLAVVRKDPERLRLSLVRISTTLLIVGIAEHLFFREPITTAMLFIAAAGIAFAAICAPREPAGALDDGHEPTDELRGGRDGGEEHA